MNQRYDLISGRIFNLRRTETLLVAKDESRLQSGMEVGKLIFCKVVSVPLESVRNHQRWKQIKDWHKVPLSMCDEALSEKYTKNTATDKYKKNISKSRY